MDSVRRIDPKVAVAMTSGELIEIPTIEVGGTILRAGVAHPGVGALTNAKRMSFSTKLRMSDKFVPHLDFAEIHMGPGEYERLENESRARSPDMIELNMNPIRVPSVPILGFGPRAAHRIPGVSLLAAANHLSSPQSMGSAER